MQAIAAGVDLFDCVIPTRLARHGAALVQGDRWNLKKFRFREDFTPLDELALLHLSALQPCLFMSSGAITGNFGLHSVDHSQHYRFVLPKGFGLH